MPLLQPGVHLEIGGQFKIRIAFARDDVAAGLRFGSPFSWTVNTPSLIVQP